MFSLSSSLFIFGFFFKSYSIHKYRCLLCSVLIVFLGIKWTKNLMLVYFFSHQKMHLYFIFRFLKILGCTHFCNLTRSKTFSIFPSPFYFLTMKIFLLWQRFKLDLSFFIHFNLARCKSYCDVIYLLFLYS